MSTAWSRKSKRRPLNEATVVPEAPTLLVITEVAIVHQLHIRLLIKSHFDNVPRIKVEIVMQEIHLNTPET
jgi:hypothetical protein